MRHSNLNRTLICIIRYMASANNCCYTDSKHVRRSLEGQVADSPTPTSRLRRLLRPPADDGMAGRNKCPTVVHRQPCSGPARHRSPCLLFVSTAASFVFCRTFMQTVAGCPVLQLSQAESGPHYSQKYPPSERLA